jgi:hypothetical protein
VKAPAIQVVSGKAWEPFASPLPTNATITVSSIDGDEYITVMVGGSIPRLYITGLEGQPVWLTVRIPGLSPRRFHARIGHHGLVECVTWRHNGDSDDSRSG